MMSNEIMMMMNAVPSPDFGGEVCRNLRDILEDSGVLPAFGTGVTQGPYKTRRVCNVANHFPNHVWGSCKTLYARSVFGDSGAESA